MANVVLVRKQDRGTDLHGGHIGNKLFVLLIDDRLFLHALDVHPLSPSVDDCVGNERAFAVFNGNVKRTC